MIAAPLALYSILTVADCGSTAVALSRGAVETNPLFHNAGGCVAAHTLLFTGPLILIDQHADKGARKKLRILTVAIEVVAGSLIAAHNLRVK